MTPAQETQYGINLRAFESWRKKPKWAVSSGNKQRSRPTQLRRLRAIADRTTDWTEHKDIKTTYKTNALRTALSQMLTLGLIEKRIHKGHAEYRKATQ